ncbi:MAG: hypothetical protein DRM98_00355 [Thermoplasmata archaeon]|nr:MAG: hypothetical protein DRM98_00355 [Thermoplasmata archaeon]
MIEIIIYPRDYTRDELYDRLSHFFPTSEDLDLFISMMQETNQLTYRDGVFHPVTAEIVERTTPVYLTIPSESEVMGDRINQIYVFRWTYYTTAAGEKLPRIAIRAGANWIKKRGVPVSVTLLKIYKNGRWIDIPEKPTLTPGIPRYPSTIEAYRAEIPRNIVRKYGITRDTPLRVRIDRRVTAYYSTLRLWGLSLDTIITSIGETPKHLNDRNLELRGHDFVYPTDENIIDRFRAVSGLILNVLDTWLGLFDEEYHSLFTAAINKDVQRPDFKGATGAKPEPLVEETSRTAVIEFTDLDKGRLIGKAEATLSPRWYLRDAYHVATQFKTVYDDIGMAHGYKGRAGLYIALTGKEGFK